MHTVQINCFDFSDINLLQELLWKVHSLEGTVDAPFVSERSLHIYTAYLRSFPLRGRVRGQLP